jgi:hypothetical protein
LLSIIPSQYHFYISIGGLVLLLLLINAVAQRYQAHQLEKEAVLRRIFAGALRIQTALGMLDGCAVPKKLRVLLRKEILARYMAVRQIYRRFKDINNLISRAQQDLSAAEARAENSLVKPADSKVYYQYVKGLTELIIFLQSEGSIVGMNEDQRQRYEHDLGVLRADYVSIFHSSEAIALAEKQKWNEAGREMKHALQFFQSHGPADKHVKDLYRQANLYYRQVVNRQIPGTEDDPQTGQQSSISGTATVS